MAGLPVFTLHRLPCQRSVSSHATNKWLCYPVHNISTLLQFLFACALAGYGDVTVEKNTNLSIFYGILYMIASVLVAMTAFSAAAERAVSPIAEFNKRVLGSIPALSSFSKHFMSTITGDLKEDELLYKRVGRMRLFALTEVTLQFVSLNLFGVFVARIFVLAWHADKAAWTWMTTFYWAVQTTTTIGKAFNGSLRMQSASL